MEKITSRRGFIKSSFKYGVTMAAGAAGASCGIHALSTPSVFAATPKTHEWPWPYAILDKELGRKLGHDSYWSGKGCAYAAFHPIVALLRDTVGEPFHSLPTELMIFGHGGGVGWGSLCGALNGAGAAISLVCSKETSDKLVDELFNWYTQVELPTTLSNQYGVEKQYTVNKYDQIIKPCNSGSVLCHVSASNWCGSTKVEITDVKRKERCARLTGDTVAYAIQLLNDNHENRFKASYGMPESVKACNVCHGQGGEQVDVLSKMDCRQCHGDPHKESS